MENKSLVNLDMKSLYTNNPMNKCIKLVEIHLKKNYITFNYENNKKLHIIHDILLFRFNGFFFKLKIWLTHGFLSLKSPCILFS